MTRRQNRWDQGPQSHHRGCREGTAVKAALAEDPNSVIKWLAVNYSSSSRGPVLCPDSDAADLTRAHAYNVFNL